MSDTRRVTLTFDLDNEDERQAFNIINSLGYRNKAKGVTQLLLKENKKRTQAEEIAEKVVQLLQEHNVAIGISPATKPILTDQPKRKRGRPRKNPEPLSIPATVSAPVQILQQPTHSITDDTADMLPDDDMLASMQAFIGGL